MIAIAKLVNALQELQRVKREIKRIERQRRLVAKLAKENKVGLSYWRNQ